MAFHLCSYYCYGHQGYRNPPITQMPSWVQSLVFVLTAAKFTRPTARRPISLRLMWIPLLRTLSIKNNTTVLTGLNYWLPQVALSSMLAAACLLRCLLAIAAIDKAISALLLVSAPTETSHDFFKQKSLPLTGKIKGRQLLWSHQRMWDMKILGVH
jgi:hypothetical protein